MRTTDIITCHIVSIGILRSRYVHETICSTNNQPSASLLKDIGHRCHHIGEYTFQSRIPQRATPRMNRKNHDDGIYVQCMIYVR